MPPDAPVSEPASRPNVSLLIEQTLGHITYGHNLTAALRDSERADVTLVPIPFPNDGPAAKVPGMKNWTVRSGIRTAQAIRRQRRRSPIDAMLIHTQVLAVLNVRWLRRIPTVVSLDATPLQFDQLGEHYAHSHGSARSEALKRRLNARCYRRAASVIAWSEWTRQSLIDDYDLAPEAITVLAGGVDVPLWARDEGEERPGGPLRVLFVGGDFDRKGGPALLEAARALRAEASMPAFVLDVVTGADVAAEPGVVVHHGLAANSADLVALYRAADVFCLPTLADCLPNVLAEAAAAGAAIVTTDVGAIAELVRPDESGLLVTPGDIEGLTDALRRVLEDASLRQRLARRAGEIVRDRYDASRNASRLLDLLVEAASRRPATPVGRLAAWARTRVRRARPSPPVARH